MAGSLHSEQKVPVAHAPRGSAPDSQAGRHSGAHGRWRVGRENHLAEHAGHHGLYQWRKVFTRVQTAGIMHNEMGLTLLTSALLSNK